jgi:hypothetical protein
VKKRPALSKSYLYLFLFSLVAAVASFSLVRIIDDFGAYLAEKNSAMFDGASQTLP